MRSPSLSRWSAVAFIAASGAVGPATVTASAQQEIFEQGNQFYQVEDYSAAVEAYEAVHASGFESPDLQYNLGNAYFKTGELGRSILSWERALRLAPGHEDAAANLELAVRLSADDIEPLPRFWLLSAVSWWVNLIPRSALLAVVALAWLALTCGALARTLVSAERFKRLGGWGIAAGAVVLVLLGTNLAVREFEVGQPERGVILAEAVLVRSAPTDDDDLTVFEVHEGTRVLIDQRTEQWAEIVLDDGKVGWVPVEVMEVI
jgi:tetratricopeptide (TPR) repeat protein